MTSLLDQINTGVAGLEHQASSLATTVSNDASQFVKGAQANVAALLASGVNAQGKPTGPLADHFGTDPVQFAVNSVKFFDSFMRGLVNRLNVRTKKTSFSVPAGAAFLGAAGSVTGTKNVTVPTALTSKDPSARVALVVTLYAINNPAELLEEAGRQQQGLPVAHGLDGPWTWYPQYLPARGFFGIDEAAAAAAALAILVAIAPAIITALISVVGAIAPSIASAIGIGQKPPPPPPPGLLGISGLDPTIVIVVAAAVGAYILLVHKKHA